MLLKAASVVTQKCNIYEAQYGDVPNPPFVSDLNHINLTLENVLQSTNETLILGYAFKYGTENWKDTGFSGSCATQMSWNWTIPSNLRSAESEYRLMLHNHTAVGPPDDDYDESSIYIGDIGNVYTDSGLRSVYRR
ncbi:hypothetical protein CFRS1_v013609 [Colletotrichum fructicola]|nr:hypothetical protein CFRS1_v013609 [Colletotrichum fructicola]